MALCAAMLFGIAAAPVAGQRHAKDDVQPTAILTVMSGDVLIRTARGDFSPAMDGAVLYVGTILRTSADARALITLFEGSTVELDPASDITIEGASTGSGSTIAQAFARSLHVVMHLTTADSRYEMTTPAATASVRGGEFEVTAAALTGVAPTTSAPEHRVATTMAVTIGAAFVTPAQTTSLTNAASISRRSSGDAERIRRAITRTRVTRALPVARDRS